jgi:hypothetical protein
MIHDYLDWPKSRCLACRTLETGACAYHALVEIFELVAQQTLKDKA